MSKTNIKDNLILPEVRLKLDLDTGYKLNLGKLSFSSYQDQIEKGSKELLDGSNREIAIAFFLDSSKNPISYLVVALGTQDGVTFNTGEVAKAALLLNASYVVMVHNHPSGEREFSVDDLIITKKVYETLKNLGINLLDSIILPQGKKSFSLRNDLQMFYDLIIKKQMQEQRELENFYIEKVEEINKNK